MVLAFVYNPVQSSIIYLALTIYILCLYLLFWSIELCCCNYIDCLCLLCKRSHKHNKKQNDTPKYKVLKWFIFLPIIYLVYAVIYTSYIFILILKMGSFNDFQGAQSFVLPLMIGIIYFVGKPFYKKAKKSFDFGNNETTANA